MPCALREDDVAMRKNYKFYESDLNRNSYIRGGIVKLIKVLVVDDEKIVRLGLVALCDWRKHGFLFSYEASNGVEALEILKSNHDIQIVLVDVQMPKMDGLQFLEEVRKKKLNVAVIVLSAHTNHNLIKKAFKLGAIDYIVKSEMNENEILKQLKNALKLLSDAKIETLNCKDRVHLKGKYLSNLLLNINTEPVNKCLEVLGIPSSLSYFLVCSILFDNNVNLKEQLYLIRNLIKDTGKSDFFVEVVAKGENELAMLCAFKRKNTEFGFVLQNIKNKLQNYLNLEVTIGVSNVASSIKNIHYEYKTAKENVCMRFILGNGKIIFPNDINSITNRNIGSISHLTKELISAIDDRNREAVLCELEKIFSVISEYNPTKIEKIFPYYIEIIFSLRQYLNSIGEDEEKLFGRFVNFYDEINEFNTRAELNAFIKSIIMLMFENLNKNEREDSNRLVMRAKEFIKQNFTDNSISLKMVAEHVGLSESYLSSIFSKHTSKNFTEYVTELRIKQAEKLLKETNLKVYQISEKIGFSNAEYFSKTFKKITGKSPNRFFH